MGSCCCTVLVGYDPFPPPPPGRGRGIWAHHALCARCCNFAQRRPWGQHAGDMVWTSGLRVLRVMCSCELACVRALDMLHGASKHGCAAPARFFTQACARRAACNASWPLTGIST